MTPTGRGTAGIWDGMIHGIMITILHTATMAVDLVIIPHGTAIAGITHGIHPGIQGTADGRTGIGMITSGVAATM
jgi:hypothetical protein